MAQSEDGTAVAAAPVAAPAIPPFLGTHSPRLDDKGRLFLPAKFRDGSRGAS